MEVSDEEIGDVCLEGVGLSVGGFFFGKVLARGMEAQIERTCMYVMVEDK
jgi:hypothetical protein